MGTTTLIIFSSSSPVTIDPANIAVFIYFFGFALFLMAFMIIREL